MSLVVLGGQGRWEESYQRIPFGQTKDAWRGCTWLVGGPFDSDERLRPSPLLLLHPQILDFWVILLASCSVGRRGVGLAPDYRHGLGWWWAEHRCRRASHCRQIYSCRWYFPAVGGRGRDVFGHSHRVCPRQGRYDVRVPPIHWQVDRGVAKKRLPELRTARGGDAELLTVDQAAATGSFAQVQKGRRRERGSSPDESHRVVVLICNNRRRFLPIGLWRRVLVGATAKTQIRRDHPFLEGLRNCAGIAGSRDHWWLLTGIGEDYFRFVDDMFDGCRSWRRSCWQRGRSRCWGRPGCLSGVIVRNIDQVFAHSQQRVTLTGGGKRLKNLLCHNWKKNKAYDFTQNLG